MDILNLGTNHYKLKGKTASAVVLGNKVTIEPSGFVISDPGEYEVGGVSVLSFGDSVFVVEIDNLRIIFLSQKPSEQIVAEAGAIDIAVSDNIDVAKSVDPWIAVTTTPVAGVEAMPKLTTTSDKLPPDLQVVVLSSK